MERKQNVAITSTINGQKIKIIAIKPAVNRWNTNGGSINVFIDFDLG